MENKDLSQSYSPDGLGTGEVGLIIVPITLLEHQPPV
jgi:hypothetical protein